MSQIEIITKCSSPKSLLSNSCSSKSQLIDVSVEVLDEGSDPNNVLSYVYKVSGGEIIGKGAKVMWDLSGVKAGIYTINAGVDDGIGVFGKGVTKEIKVIECADCQ